MAARLAALGGALPGIAPGEATAAHLDRVISRTAGFGAAYLVLVMLLPDFLTSFFGLPIALGAAACVGPGEAGLVAVAVSVDRRLGARCRRRRRRCRVLGLREHACGR